MGHKNLTKEQRTLSDDLKFVIGGKDIIPLLKKIEKKDLLPILSSTVLMSNATTTIHVHDSSNKKTTILGYAIELSDDRSIQSIIDVAKKNGILREVLDVKEVFNQIGHLKIFLKENNDQYTLNEIYQIEKSIAFDKAMRVGAICGVIAGLAVGGGCFAAGAALPILTLIGIAVAAALVTGLIAGGITYKMSMPSEVPSQNLDNIDAEQGVSSELGGGAAM